MLEFDGMGGVAVLGLGDMGSAIAKSLLSHGPVAVWNRTQSRGESLVTDGAWRIDTPRQAIERVDTILICVNDYLSTQDILDGADYPSLFDGKLVVQLTSGTPNQARALAQWVTERNGLYLDGTIGAWPRQIGGPDASLVMAGERDAFERAHDVLHKLAGRVTHIGTDAGHAAALANAGLAYFAGHWLGFAQGAAISASEGLDAIALGDMLAEMSAIFVDDLRLMGRAVATSQFGDAESTIKTVSGDLRWLSEITKASGQDTRFAQLAADMFSEANRAGWGQEQHTAVYKVFRATAGKIE